MPLSVKPIGANDSRRRKRKKVIPKVAAGYFQFKEKHIWKLRLGLADSFFNIFKMKTCHSAIMQANFKAIIFILYIMFWYKEDVQ